jgi:hypothetical protein
VLSSSGTGLANAASPRARPETGVLVPCDLLPPRHDQIIRVTSALLLRLVGEITTKGVPTVEHEK